MRRRPPGGWGIDMRQRHASAWVAAALGALLIALTPFLAACQSQPEGREHTGATPTPPGLVDKGAGTGESAAITIPQCDAVNPAAEAEQTDFLTSFGRERITAKFGETDRALFNEFATPGALMAVKSVVQERSCNWVIYLDSVYLYQLTAELPQSAMQPLIDDLREADFAESTRGPATVFTKTIATGDMRGAIGVSHSFVGDVWIVLIENAANSYEQSAVDAILAANPALARTVTTSCVDHKAKPAIEQATAQLAADGDHGHDIKRAIDLAEHTFDACMPLSWALLPAAADRESTAAQVLLFHYGDFVGTDSDTELEGTVTVTRVSKYALRTDYRWDAGEARTTFTWSPETKSVVREGELPPA